MENFLEYYYVCLENYSFFDFVDNVCWSVLKFRVGFVVFVIGEIKLVWVREGVWLLMVVFIVLGLFMGFVD